MERCKLIRYMFKYRRIARETLGESFRDVCANFWCEGGVSQRGSLQRRTKYKWYRVDEIL